MRSGGDSGVLQRLKNRALPWQFAVEFAIESYLTLLAKGLYARKFRGDNMMLSRTIFTFVILSLFVVTAYGNVVVLL